MRTCTAYRRRGPSWAYECDLDFAPDRVPETGCADPRVVAAYLRRPTAGACAGNGAVCR